MFGFRGRERRFLGVTAAAVVLGFGLAACEPVPVVLNLTVNTAADGDDAVPGDGVCEATAGVGNCTLRAAITESNREDGLDVITIGPGIDPELSIAGGDEDFNATGDLDVSGEVVIEGGGATVDAVELDRVFDVRSGALTLRDLTVTGGRPPAGDPLVSTMGSGVMAHGKLTLERVRVTGNNTAQGALASNSSSVRLVDTEISDNVGSIVVVLRSSTLHMSRSTIVSPSDGLGVFATASEGVAIADSTVVGAGQALQLNTGSTAVIGRSTLATTGTRLIDIATAEPEQPSSLIIGASILDAPMADGNPMCAGSQAVSSLGWNVAGDDSCALTATGDHQGEPGLVAALADNGGPTRTALLVPGSPAIDHIPAGTPSLCDGVADQRGVPRPQGVACDAGAVEGVDEGHVGDAVSFTVDTAADGVDATPGDGVCATADGACTFARRSHGGQRPPRRVDGARPPDRRRARYRPGAVHPRGRRGLSLHR